MARHVAIPRFLLVAVAASAAATTAASFYIPGTGPIAYPEGGVVNVNVNGLHSIKNIVPYDYYHGPFCRPDVIVSRHETLGEMLSGENQRSSPYYFNMLFDTSCKVISECNSGSANIAKGGAKKDAPTFTPNVLTTESAELLEKLIEKKYRAYLVVDNLPAFKNNTGDFQNRCVPNYRQLAYERGFALGVSKKCTGTKKTLINNHLHFRVQYHRVDRNTVFTVGDTDVADGEITGQSAKKEKREKRRASTDNDDFLVVGVTVEPFSVNWPNIGADGSVSGCGEDFNPFMANIVPLDTSFRGPIAWTYGVTWVEEPAIRWATRWESYLKTSTADTNSRVHWVSILNTLIIVFILCSSVFAVVVRSMRKQIAHYNIPIDISSEEAAEIKRDSSGWKCVSGDVFRPPTNTKTFTVLMATGAQVALMVITTLSLSLFGFLSPSTRGGMMTALLSTFMILAVLTGYVTARLHIKFGGERSWSMICKAGSLVPGVCFAAFTVCNILLKSARSSGSVPFPTLVALLLIWWFVAIPLSLIGASIGFRVVPSPNPQRTSAVPRPVDPSIEHTLLRNEFALLLSGFIPLAAVFLELRFILQSVWQGAVYYVFGFLFITVVLWAITCALVSITITYYKLSAENYRWWWAAFLAPSSAGLHLGAFLLYNFSALHLTSVVAMFMYFIYMALAVLLYVLASGSIGAFAAWGFVLMMYGSIKSE